MFDLTAKPDENIIVRRTGEPILCVFGCLISSLLILPLVYLVLSSSGGKDVFPYGAIAVFLLTCYFFQKSLPRSTLFDMTNRNVRIRPNGWRTETISFDNIHDIRTVTREAGSGYCLRLKSDPLFDCRIISDLTPETPYTREFRLQSVPRIRLALADNLPDPTILPAARQTCFAQKGNQWERTLKAFPYAPLLFPVLLFLIFSDYILTEKIGKYVVRALALVSFCFLLIKTKTLMPFGFLPERRYLVDSASRTVEISRGILFLQKSKIFSFDDLEAICVRISDRATKSVYLRFAGDNFLYLAAYGTPDKLREILACYASVMDMDLSEKIEYIV